MSSNDSFLNDDDEKRDIEMFLTMVDHLHKPDGINTFLWNELIISYLHNLLKHCSSTIHAESKQGSSQYNLPEVPDQLLLIIGKINTQISYGALNDIGLHKTIISVLNTLEQYSWGTKVLLTVASYILTYGDNGLNLCCETKLIANDESVDFLWDSMKTCKYFHIVEWLIERVDAIAESKDPSVIENEARLIVDAYSIIRVVVIAASSQLMTRSSGEDKLGTFSTKWCSKKLNVIEEQLRTINDQMSKLYEKAKVVEHEDKQQLKISILVQSYVTAKDIDVYVKGDELVVRSVSSNHKFELGKKKYRKQHIEAVLDKSSVLQLTLPKILDPQSLQIKVVTV